MLNHLMNVNFISILILFLFQFIYKISCHGRLIQPAGRSTAWRFGFPTTPNYNDNQLFCGGYTVQWDINGGKCGICGDPYNGPKPNELPDGKYTKPLVITANYTEGEVISVLVQLTANHRGFFDFRLCPATSDKVEVTQECLDSHYLQVLNSADGKQYQYTVPDDAQRTYNITVALPKGLSCERCLFQWTYTAGNNWGRCDDGTSATGCGPQETFRSCADVHISSSSDRSGDGNSVDAGKKNEAGEKEVNDKEEDGDDDEKTEKEETDISEVDNDIDSTSPKLSSTTTVNPKDEIERESVTTKPTRRYFWGPTLTREREPTTPKSTQSTSKGTTTGSLKCVATGRYRKSPGMDDWCNENCNVGFCPPTHCKCE